MTAKEFLRVVENIDVSTFPLETRVTAYCDQNDAIFVDVAVNVPDVRSGLPMLVRRRDVVLTPLLPYWTPERIADFVGQLLKCLLAHEVDEHIRLNGVRIFDPHVEQPRRDSEPVEASR